MLTKIRNRRRDQQQHLDPFRERTAEEVEAERRAQVIEQAIARREKELRREQTGRPTEQRLSRQQCRVQAENDIHGAIRAAEREASIARIRADFSSTWTRNGYLIKPWFAGAGYLASGELAAVLAEADVLTSAGPLLAVTAGAAATSWTAWRMWLKHLPQKWQTRIRAGLGGACASSMALPMLPWDWHGAAVAAAAAALVGGCAGFWRSQAPSYPPPGGGEEPVDVDKALDTVPAAKAKVDPEAADIISDWDEYVRPKIMSGATLDHPQSFEHGWVFTVGLVRGQQTFATLQAAIQDIAFALNLPVTALTPDPNPDQYKPLQPTLTITTSSPDNVYTGPVIVREGGSVFIEVGPYRDGLGVVRYEILSGQLSDDELVNGELPEGPVVEGSAVGGFALGDKGSGKSRLLENIMLGALELGVEPWYLDPQGGASSSVMRDNAAWSLMGLDSADGRAFGNVEDLLTALEGVVQVRQDENSLHDWNGFHHTRQRPMILVIIDECHLVFAQYGHRFGALDRIARKLGIAFLGASQAPTQDVFGGSTTLRNGMAGANGYVLKFNGSNAGLAFGALDDVIARGCRRLPMNLGLGFAVNSARPHAVFQNRYTRNLASYFARVGNPTLDDLATIGAGQAYATRHQSMQQNRAAVQQRIAGYRSGTLKPGQKPKQSSNTGKQDGSAEGTVSYMFPGSGNQPASPTPVTQEPTRESLTDRQRSILNLLVAEQMTAKRLAAELGVTNRTVSTDLKALREGKFVRVVDETEGRYAASEDVENT